MHLNSARNRSIQPGSHKFWRTSLITHTSLLGPTITHFYSWVERVHVWVKALPKSTASTADSVQPGIEPAISRLQVAHTTTGATSPHGVCNASVILGWEILHFRQLAIYWPRPREDARVRPGKRCVLPARRVARLARYRCHTQRSIVYDIYESCRDKRTLVKR